MKIEVQTNETPRKLVAITRGGMLFLRFESSHAPSQKTVILGGEWTEDKSAGTTNGTATIETIGGTPIYEGDTVTITF
jgi:hypothetical protein